MFPIRGIVSMRSALRANGCDKRPEGAPANRNSYAISKAMNASVNAPRLEGSSREKKAADTQLRILRKKSHGGQSTLDPLLVTRVVTHRCRPAALLISTRQDA